MTYDSLVQFLRSVAPAHVEVMMGEDDILKLDDHKNDAQAYVKYNEGLDLSLQCVRHDEKTNTKVFSFRNEHELIAVLSPKVLELLDGERRI